MHPHMKFNVSVRGAFSRIKTIYPPEQFSILLKCGACATLTDKPVFISANTKKSVEVKELRGNVMETYNLVLHCKECNQPIHVNLINSKEPIKVADGSAEYDLSTLISHEAEIVKVLGLKLDVMDVNETVFEGCSLSNGILAEVDEEENKPVIIEGIEIDIKEIK